MVSGYKIQQKGRAEKKIKTALKKNQKRHKLPAIILNVSIFIYSKYQKVSNERILPHNWYGKLIQHLRFIV